MCKKYVIVKGDYSGTNYNSFLLIHDYLCVSIGLEILCPHTMDFRDFLYLQFNNIS